MELSVASKKKKRRTRKCLDEIRKRSQLTKDKTSLQNDKPKKAEVKSHHRLVTMNRLTLNMFPKAICSETITRPLLEELRQKSSYNDCKEFQENSKSPMRSKVMCFDNISMASNNSMPLFDLEEETVREQGTIEIKDLLNLHSPTNLNISEAPAELTTRVYSRCTSLSSQTLDEDPGPELYEDLMNQISSHLRKVTSAINIKEDIINDTKITLHKMLFTKSGSKKYQLHMLENENSRKSKQKETKIQSPNMIPIVQNPMDYIRLKQQFMYDECSTGFSKRFSPLSSSSPTSERECPPLVNLIDTPEYNYYPHRLN